MRTGRFSAMAMALAAAASVVAAAPPTGRSLAGPGAAQVSRPAPDAMLEVPVEVAPMLARSLGVAVAPGDTLRVDPRLLLPSSSGQGVPKLIQRTHDGDEPHNGFAIFFGGNSGGLADHNGDGRDEIASSIEAGTAVLDGATGRPLVRVTDLAVGALGVDAGRPQILGLADIAFDWVRSDCASLDGGVTALFHCVRGDLTITYDGVLRDARTGLERWRTSWGVTQSNFGTGSSVGIDILASSTDAYVVRDWVPLLEGDILRGHVTARLEGSTTIQSDATGMGGTASGEGEATLWARGPDGTVLVERTITTAGPSRLRSHDDVTGDGVPDVALVQAAWDPGTFLCLPLQPGEQGVEPGGCLFPYDASHLDVQVLDGRTLETIDAWSHHEPVGRSPLDLEFLPVGDVDGDGRSDAVVGWATFQDSRWSAGEQWRSPRLAAYLATSGQTAPIGSVGTQASLGQVRRTTGAATVVLSDMVMGSGSGVEFQQGWTDLPLPRPVGSGYTTDGSSRVYAEYAYELVDLPSGVTRDRGQYRLEQLWQEGDDRGDTMALFGDPDADLDGDGLRDAVLGLGHDADGPWVSETLWTGTAGKPALHEAHLDVSRWRIPFVDLDLDGGIDTLFFDWSPDFGPADPRAPAIYRGRTDTPLWRRPPKPHGIAWTSDVDGVPGPDVRIRVRDEGLSDWAWCLARGTTGATVWCFDGV